MEEIEGEGDETDVFHTCPFQFIPVSCWEWYELYVDQEIDFPHTRPHISLLSRRYLSFRAYYQRWISKFRKIMGE